VVSYVYNQFFATTDNWANAAKLIDDPNTGKFINPAAWDDVNGALITGKGKCTLYRNKIGTSATLLNTVTVSATTANGAPSAMCSSVSATGKAQFYVGTDVGKVYMTTDIGASVPVWSDITGTINAGNISDIFRLRRSDTLFVTLSNYGSSVNIYMSLDAGKTWISRDGNIADMPIWGILLNPRKMGEAIIATELGIYGTSNIFAASVVWAPYNEGMGAVKVANLRYRDADQTIMAATHGRGVFTSDAWSKASPIVKFGLSTDTVCSHQTISFKDSSLNLPNTWRWRFSPSLDVVFRNATDSTKQNPIVQFTKSGTYTVTLWASNAIGEDQLTKVNSIYVIDSIPMTVSIKTNPAVICVNDTFSIESSVNTNGKTVALSYSWKKNGLTQSNTGSNWYGLQPNSSDKFQLFVQSTTQCVTPNPANTAIVSPVMQGVKTLTVSCNLDTLKAANVGSGTYNWYKNGVWVGSGRLFKPNSIGLYRCMYVENGCKSDSSAIIILKSLIAHDPKTMNIIAMYPNPANDFVMISGKGLNGCRLKVLDINGREVIKGQRIETENFMLYIPSVMKGIYFLEIQDFTNTVIFKQSLVISN
jgi:PKD repeat protein